MKTSNIFKNIPETLKDELFEDIVNSKNIKIERIISDGQTSPKEGWHCSKQNEWVIMLQGEAILSYETEDDIKLNRGEYISIPAFLKHRVSYTSKSEKSIWLAIYYL